MTALSVKLTTITPELPQILMQYEAQCCHVRFYSDSRLFRSESADFIYHNRYQSLFYYQTKYKTRWKCGITKFQRQRFSHFEFTGCSKTIASSIK